MGPDVQAKTKLLFRWGRRRWNWRLTFLVLLSLIGHFFAFYIFQVVYPPTVRTTPEPMRVTLLHPSNTHSARLLRELDDRLYSLYPAESTELTEFSAGRPQATFSPSFRGHEIPLREAPLAEWKETRNTPLVLGGAVLPPAAPVSSQVDPAEAQPPSALSVRAGAPLQGRALKVDAARLPFNPADSDGRLRAQISVLPDGRIANLIIDEEPDVDLPAQAAGQLRQALRFDPAPNAPALEWTWLEVQW